MYQITSTRKLDSLIIIILIAFTFFSITSLFTEHARFMFDIDSYEYYELATSNVNEKIPSTSIVYISFLSFVYKIYGNSDALFFLRIVISLFTIQLVVFLYLIARNMFNPFFSMVAAITASFSPILLSYSGTLHNDIFALAMGFTSLYFATKPNTRSLISSLSFLFITSLVRLDISILFFIPFLISFTLFITKKFQIRFLYLFSIFLALGISFGVFTIQNTSFYASRFNPLEKLILFLRFQTLETVWSSSTEITSNDHLNIFFTILLIGGFIASMFCYRKKILCVFLNKNNNLAESQITPIYLVLVFFISIVSATVFHIGYVIEENETLIINSGITVRYLIPIQTLLVFGIPLVLVSLFYFLTNKYGEFEKDRIL